MTSIADPTLTRKARGPDLAYRQAAWRQFWQRLLYSPIEETDGGRLTCQDATTTIRHSSTPEGTTSPDDTTSLLPMAS